MTSHSDEQLGCDVGWLLREKDAESFIKCALARLEYDRDPLIAEVVRTVLGARHANNSDIQDEKKLVAKELVLLEEKKLRAVDACYSGNISEDELAKLRTLYDQRLESLYKRQEMLEFQGEKEHEFAERIRSAAEALLSGKEGSSLLYKTLVQEMTVFRTRTVHLRFCCLPQIFVFRETD